MIAPKILYLAVGVFDKGGISRYCRSQIRAFRELVGEQNVCSLSFFAPGADDFEEPFQVDYHAQGPSRAADVAFAVAIIKHARAMRPDLIWSSHLHFMPHTLAARALIPASCRSYSMFMVANYGVGINGFISDSSALRSSDCGLTLLCRLRYDITMDSSLSNSSGFELVSTLRALLRGRKTCG